ncbi:MAG: tetratricopeptide repeat protein [Pseudolabrys sp.]
MADPATARELLQQGLFHHRQGDLAIAMERYVEVLRTDPQNADALYYVGVVACQEGQFKQGVELARRAIAVGPPQARVHNLLGQALDRLGEPMEAIKNFDKAIALDPDFAAAHGNRANILVDAGMAAEALKSFDRAIALNPNSAPDLINRGALLEELGRPTEALADYDRATAADAAFAPVHANRASVLKDLGLMELGGGAASSPRFDAAAAAYDRAIALDPRLHEAFLGRGLLNLMRGNWPTGFADYEHRSEVGRPGYTALPQPRWDGVAREGERVVLVAEQGLGDTIQFCRFAPLLAERGVDVTILVRKAMAPLLSTLQGATIVSDTAELAQDKQPLRWLPLLSVPGALGITPDNLPRKVPYLSAEPARIEAWRARLGNGGFKIGINWSPGHADKTHTSRRDIALTNFAGLAALPGVELVSLQKGVQADEIGQVAFRDKIKIIDADPDADADFFLDTAAVMSLLDLIIGCDTSVAHLAGALARPVFTAVPVISDWRWLLSRDDTPWYPTMRIFRQDASRQWEPVFARIVEAVRTGHLAPSQD